MICPHCQHVIEPRRRKTVAAPVDPASMTDAQVFAHYHRTAPVEDLKFFLRVATMSDGLRSRVADLLRRAEAGLSRHAVYREYVVLQDAWRRESNERERAERVELERAA